MSEKDSYLGRKFHPARGMVTILLKRKRTRLMQYLLGGIEGLMKEEVNNPVNTMHNSFIPNPNEVKFVTILKRFERATTLMKEPFSFEVHRKSYSRWKK